MMNDKKMVLLDVGGVIRDSSISMYKGFEIGFRNKGLPFNFKPKDVWNLMGLCKFNHVNMAGEVLYMLTKSNDQYKLESIMDDDDAESLLDRYLSNITSEDIKISNEITKDSKNYFDSDQSKSDIRLYDNTDEALENFKLKGFVIGVFSNSRGVTLERDLSRLKNKNYFSIIISSDDVNNPKPDSEGIELAMDKLNVEVDNTFYVGDSVSDVIAAKRAECKSVAVLSGMGTKKHLMKSHPDFIFKNLYEASLKLS